MPVEVLPSAARATTLLPHLLATLSASKRSRVKALLQSGRAHVNGVSVTRHDHPVGPGDRLELRDEPAPPPRKLPFPILYEDAQLIAIDKPNGLLTVGTKHEKVETAYGLVNRALAASRERAFVVHRLDRYTSGVLLLAKSVAAQNKIRDAWTAAQKTYHALVEGAPRPPRRHLVHYLREDERLMVHAQEAASRDAKRAALSFETERASGEWTLLRIALETGRKNQIRAQLAAIGHPVAGDAKYGAKTDPLGRLCLHASSLSIPHPVTGQRIRFDAPMPL